MEPWILEHSAEITTGVRIIMAAAGGFAIWSIQRDLRAAWAKWKELNAERRRTPRPPSHEQAIDQLVDETGMGRLQAHRHLQSRKTLQDRMARRNRRRHQGTEPEN